MQRVTRTCTETENTNSTPTATGKKKAQVQNVCATFPAPASWWPQSQSEFSPECQESWCFVPVRTRSICILVLIIIGGGRTTKNLKSWGRKERGEQKVVVWHLCLSPVVSIFNKCLPLCWVFAHPWTWTHLRGRAGSTTSYSACQTFPIIKPCFQLLITLLNLNHLGFNFPCQVSALGWIFCYPFFFFFHCQPIKRFSCFREDGQGKYRSLQHRNILGNLSCKILCLPGVEKGLEIWRIEKSYQIWSSKIILKTLFIPKQYLLHLCNSIFPGHVLAFSPTGHGKTVWPLHHSPPALRLGPENLVFFHPNCPISHQPSLPKGSHPCFNLPPLPPHHCIFQLQQGMQSIKM